jgi:phosphomannomutase/phosphoglucomutase
MATVKSVKADFGVAFDGDADRSIFIDEEGEVQWGDRTFAIIAKSFLQSNPGETVVTPVSSSLVVKDIADEYDGKLIVTKVGSTIVSHTMKRVNAKLGGEENGGVFYGPHQPVRDGAMTAALILEMMATTNRSLSDLLNELPQYYLTKDKMRCSNIQKAVILKELISRLKHLNPNTIDGVKLVLDDKSSILIRPSGTEELIRLYAEAQTQKQASNLIKEYKNIIKDLMVPLDRT